MAARLSNLDAVIVLEEIARFRRPFAFPVFESCFGPILAIAHFAPEALRKRLIPKVVAGKSIVAVAMSGTGRRIRADRLAHGRNDTRTNRASHWQKRWCSARAIRRLSCLLQDV